MATNACRRQRSLNQKGLRAAGLDSWPLETTAAFELLEQLGYRATRARLDYLVARGEFIAPRKFAGRMLWSEGDLLDLADVLESRRWWLPFHRHHSAKMTAAERAQLCSAVGDEVLAQRDLATLVACLAEAGRRSTRQKLLRAIRRRVSSQPQSVARELAAAPA